MQRVYRHSTRVSAVVICGLGVAMVVTTIVRGGGALALGVVLGVAFVAIGAARLYLSSGR